MTTRPHDSEAKGKIAPDVEDWIRQFTKHLELQLLEASRDLAPNVSVARAILATFIDSGMEIESAMELLGQAALESHTGAALWSDALNARRFALIDKEIQGALTPAESIELAGLTRIMRDHIESETNLPMKGARALHQKLLQLKRGNSD
ncbi:MAG: hypothetical protein L0215_04705 [Gemmataceae bacterium]|nr:hypothetical protein [Gemmataceae bacterium]